MIIEHKPWEWTTFKTGTGGYTLVRADEKTREKQLKEFKEKRKAELLEEIRKIEMLY